MENNLPIRKFKNSMVADAIANINTPLHLIGLQNRLAASRLRNLPMSTAAQDAKNKEVEVMLSNIAVLGYN